MFMIFKKLFKTVLSLSLPFLSVVLPLTPFQLTLNPGFTYFPFPAPGAYYPL